ncbi:hypothetical protein [Duncaniella muris]|uniref:hypothetical protein n=1 Tax=Duncaniella muris TaxID=2094150 RepID=UPI0025A5B51D|nr:hypothetical protein [Duncaniella muris]
MKSINKTIKDNRIKTHQAVCGWLKPRMNAVGTRWRIAARIRLANSWATKNPKKTFGYVVGTLLMVLLVDVAFTGARAEMNNPELARIANVEPIFNGFRTIQANKEAHRKTILELTSQGQSIRQELDSMIRIPVKSHADSIGIIKRYNSLENIVKSLKQNDTND